MLKFNQLLSASDTPAPVAPTTLGPAAKPEAQPMPMLSDGSAQLLTPLFAVDAVVLRTFFGLFDAAFRPPPPLSNIQKRSQQNAGRRIKHAHGLKYMTSETREVHQKPTEKIKQDKHKQRIPFSLSLSSLVSAFVSFFFSLARPLKLEFWDVYVKLVYPCARVQEQHTFKWVLGRNEMQQKSIASFTRCPSSADAVRQHAAWLDGSPWPSSHQRVR